MKIIVIGLNRPPEEWLTLYKIGEWLKKHRPGYHDLATRLENRTDLDIYDMATLPEKGDGMDAINGDTAMVVALHLFGIDKIPGGNTAAVTELDKSYYYNRDNLNLLRLCMEHGIPLIATGDQPWLRIEKRTAMYGVDKLDEPVIYLYEKRHWIEKVTGLPDPSERLKP